MSRDVENNIVVRGDDRITLTPLEFRIFESLAARVGEIVSPGEIAVAIGWNTDARHSNLVAVYVGYLRRKLGKEAITTKRGQGYILTESQGQLCSSSAAKPGDSKIEGATDNGDPAGDCRGAMLEVSR